MTKGKNNETLRNISIVLILCICIGMVGVYVTVADSTITSDYYVATWGSDSNPGTETQPWLTIQKAADTLTAGDMVYIKEGTYNERVIPQNSGSPGNYITYAAYPGHVVSIDGTGVSVYPEGLFRIDGKNYIKVSGLRIENYHPENGACHGIHARNNCNHIIIENNYVKNTGGCGIYAKYSDNVIIDNNEVSYTNLDPAWDKEVISLHGVDTFEVKNNHVHHVNHIGIDAKADCLNGKIYRNYVHDLGIYDGRGQLGIYIDGAYNIDVYENVIHDISGGGLVLGLERPQYDDLEKINVYNNIVYDSEFGIMLWAFPGTEEYVKNLKFINNICYKNDKDGIYIGDLPIENIITRNNIVSNNGRYQIQKVGSITGLTVDHNLIDGSTQITGDDYVEGNPKFVNPAVGNFHLQEDSPAIDSGSSVDAPSVDYDGNLRPQGAGYDIGAYEADYNEGIYEECTGEVNVVAGEIVSVHCSMSTTNGSVQFTSVPSGACIYIDGVDQEVMTPATIEDIHEGSYTYLLIFE